MNKLLIASLFLLVSFSLKAQDEKPERIHEGEMAPAFTVTTLDGHVFDLAKLRGKVIYLNFFATWCPDCQKEMPF